MEHLIVFSESFLYVAITFLENNLTPQKMFGNIEKNKNVRNSVITWLMRHIITRALRLARIGIAKVLIYIIYSFIDLWVICYLKMDFR